MDLSSSGVMRAALHHLERLAALLALTDGAGQHRPAAEAAERASAVLLWVRKKAAEDGVLAVVAYNFRALFP